MRRRLHNLFGWHAWVHGNQNGYTLWTLCKCGDVKKLYLI